jgi:hypothetical protein
MQKRNARYPCFFHQIKKPQYAVTFHVLAGGQFPKLAIASREKPPRSFAWASPKAQQRRGRRGRAAAVAFRPVHYSRNSLACCALRRSSSAPCDIRDVKIEIPEHTEQP